VKGFKIGRVTQIRTEGSKHKPTTGVGGVERREEIKQVRKKETETGKEENKRQINWSENQDVVTLDVMVTD
jgi:hypothetical protein